MPQARSWWHRRGNVTEHVSVQCLVLVRLRPGRSETPARPARGACDGLLGGGVGTGLRSLPRRAVGEDALELGRDAPVKGARPARARAYSAGACSRRRRRWRGSAERGRGPWEAMVLLLLAVAARCSTVAGLLHGQRAASRSRTCSPTCVSALARVGVIVQCVEVLRVEVAASGVLRVEVAGPGVRSACRSPRRGCAGAPSCEWRSQASGGPVSGGRRRGRPVGVPLAAARLCRRALSAASRGEARA